MLKAYENDDFKDAYYDLKYRRNVTLRKSANLPKNEDVKMLITECKKIMSEMDSYAYPAQSYIKIRSACRGGEPVRLQLYQWEEAVQGEWINKENLPNEFLQESMLITYQTGKGSDRLVCQCFFHLKLSKQ